MPCFERGPIIFYSELIFDPTFSSSEERSLLKEVEIIPSPRRREKNKQEIVDSFVETIIDTEKERETNKRMQWTLLLKQ
jgi:hypothetical protein